MDAEWSVEAGQDDPVVTVPWASPDAAVQFVDMRSGPACVHEITEAQAHPALRAALIRLNAPEGKLWTAKCDAWALDAEERDGIAAELDEETFGAGFGCYIDMLARDDEPFQSFSFHERMARAWVHSVKTSAAAQSRSEFVVRPALVDAIPGFAVTVYVWALGNDGASAYRVWERVLEELTGAILQMPVSDQDVTMSMRASSSIG